MKVSLSGLKMKKDGDNKDDASLLSEWIGPQVAKEQTRTDDFNEKRETEFQDGRPIEPESRRFKGQSIVKWFIFILFIGYMVISYYRVPLLTALGNYLILEHPLTKADLIVCTPGSPLEQSLMAAELYKRGLAPRIFIPQETPPAGIEILKRQGGLYPEESELFITTLKSLKVPESAFMMGNIAVDSIQEEAEEVREVIMGGGFRSMIIVTSPARARRAYLIFEKVFDGEKLEIMISPSHYSDLKADNWWTRDKYLNEVVFECQKVLYHTIKNLW
ncbi:MAG: YdcF family protein [Deltaproteobacteria bacterium]|uniref:YdcF family protein n=1 Tax=Candidatus Desulfacyla euxinica TaxID=2841693 RepID=A0A8J6MWT1_9DELT|nr:YdcF family protein [Candidatus Desulfacyla euxinica]